MDVFEWWGTGTGELTICVCEALQVVDGTGLEFSQVANEGQTRRLGNGDRLGHCDVLRGCVEESGGRLGGMCVSKLERRHVSKLKVCGGDYKTTFR